MVVNGTNGKKEPRKEASKSTRSEVEIITQQQRAAEKFFMKFK
jgi:hypothetical protein